MAFLSDRPVLIGSGIFDGDAVVGTLGAASKRAVRDDRSARARYDDDTCPCRCRLPSAPAAVRRPCPGQRIRPPRTSHPWAGQPPDLPCPRTVLARGLALLADVSLEVTAELGRSHLRVSELLALEPGSVIGLEREAGSPVDLLVNGTLFARAEVIVDRGSLRRPHHRTRGRTGSPREQ
jgi:flagellar motor switch protein FliN